MRRTKFSGSAYQEIMKGKTAGQLLALLAILTVVYPCLAYAGADPVIEVEYTFLEPMLERVDGEYYSVEMPDTGKFHDAVGLPLLPVKTAKVLIPQGRDVKAINIARGKRVILDREFKIEYGKPPVPMGSNIAAETKPNEKVYSSKEPFPGNLYSVVSTQFLCGYKILILNLYPVQYTPASGKVSYYEKMKVIVAHAPSGPPSIQRAKCRKLREDKTRVERLVDNPSEMYTYAPEVTPLEGPYKYVIITSEGMKSTFGTLAAWKASRGLTTLVVAVEDITPTGVDEQESLRNFIDHAYHNWGTIYVVLGGDVQIIPYRGVYGKVTGTAADNTLGRPYIDEDIPCDMYYGALDGNWDNDGDGIYGEGDKAAGGKGQNRATGDAGEEAEFFADVFIGRIPADNAQEASNQIDKIIAYESSSHTTNVLLVGRKADNITWGGTYKDKVYVYFPSWDATRLYNRDGTYSETGLIDEMNSGAHHIVNYCSHSYYTDDMGLSNNQIAGLINGVTDSNYPYRPSYFLAYSQGCMSGGFDYDDCAGEQFTVDNDNGGAFAYIGNTRYGWYTPGNYEGLSQKFDEQIFDAIFNESKTNIGVALQDSKEDLVGLVGPTGAMRWCYFELCLLGDPETPISTPSVPPDITPPADVINLATGDTTASSIDLTWTAPGDNGSTGTASQYDIRYSISAITTETGWGDAAECTGEPAPLLAGTTQSFTATGLSPNTTYYFALKTADEVPNWSELSNSPSGTTEEGVAQTMHIVSVEVHCKNNGPWVYAEATVRIVDAADSITPIKDAEVAGDWSEATTDPDSGLTNHNGLVTFKSNKVRNPTSPLTFKFTANTVTKAGWECDNAPQSGEDTWSPPTAPARTYPTALENAFPSLANPETWIPFTLSEAECVVIRIYNATGRLVRTLDLGQKAPGAYVSKEKAAYWDGRNEKGEKVASGIYFYLMEAGSFRAMKKTVILK